MDIYLLRWRCSIKSAGLCFSAPGIGLLAFVSVGGSSILTMIHLNVSNYKRFYPQRLLPNVRDERCCLVLALILAAIRMRKDAARVVIFRYGYAEMLR